MSDSTFNILSFDGGGIRGALSIKLLEKIQNETPNIVKKSNMISGTSTGSLIALGLA
ncbi:MAG: patatin-like phospholipase family protein, partial [Bacilli bacterium]|nr:patatin-like phospholipase family protein [Bacilli bacterium]